MLAELSGLLCLTNNGTLTFICGGRAVNEHNNEQDDERLKAKFRKKKYCQYMLNRKYQTENATSDESITLMNVNNAYESIKNIMSYSILLQVINKSAIIFYQKNMSNQDGQLICYFKQAQKNFSV